MSRTAGMSLADLREQVEEDRLKLAQADAMLDAHQPSLYGLCSCTRVWPCNVAHRYGQAAHRLREQLAADEPRLSALAGPTLQLPEVTR